MIERPGLHELLERRLTLGTSNLSDVLLNLFAFVPIRETRTVIRSRATVAQVIENSAVRERDYRVRTAPRERCHSGSGIGGI